MTRFAFDTAAPNLSTERQTLLSLHPSLLAQLSHNLEYPLKPRPSPTPSVPFSPNVVALDIARVRSLPQPAQPAHNLMTLSLSSPLFSDHASTLLSLRFSPLLSLSQSSRVQQRAHTHTSTPIPNSPIPFPKPIAPSPYGLAAGAGVAEAGKLLLLRNRELRTQEEEQSTAARTQVAVAEEAASTSAVEGEGIPVAACPCPFLEEGRRCFGSRREEGKEGGQTCWVGKESI